MTVQQLLALALTASLPACVDGDDTAPDIDTSCYGPRPPLAISNGLASGTVLDEIGGRGVPAALVEVLARDDHRPFANATTNPVGEFIMDLAADAPAFRKVTAEGYLDSYAFDSSHVPGDHEHQMMMTPDGADRLYRAAMTMPDRMRATALVIVEDCIGRAVPHAKIKVMNAERVLYLGADTKFDASLESTSTDSAALILNAPIGTVDIEIEHDGLTYTSWPIETHAGALSVSWRRP